MNATFVTKVEMQETGGGLDVDFVHLKSGHVIGISEDAIVLYDSVEDFYEGNNPHIENRIIEIKSRGEK